MKTLWFCLAPTLSPIFIAGCSSQAPNAQAPVARPIMPSSGSNGVAGLSSPHRGVQLQWESPHGWVDVNRIKPEQIVLGINESGDFRLVDGAGMDLPDVTPSAWKASIFGVSGAASGNWISWSYSESSVDRTDFKSVSVTYKGKKYTARFLVAPPPGSELVDFEIYGGAYSEMAVGSPQHIQVTTGANSPCKVTMEAKYADGTIAGQWHGKGNPSNSLNVNYRDTIDWTASRRPGPAVIRASYRNWQTGETRVSLPYKIELVVPTAQVTLGAWEREGDGWKRPVTVNTVLGKFGNLAAGVPLHLKIVTPPHIDTTASSLENEQGTTDARGTFATIQHWSNQGKASFDLKDYDVTATVASS